MSWNSILLLLFCQIDKNQCYFIAKHSSSDHPRFTGMIFSAKICHQPTMLLHLRQRSSILEQLITNSTELKLITPCEYIHARLINQRD